MTTDIRLLANDEKFFVDALLFNVHMRRNIGSMPPFAAANLRHMADRSAERLVEKCAKRQPSFEKTRASKAFSDTCDSIATTQINLEAYLQQFNRGYGISLNRPADHEQKCFAAAVRVEETENNLRDMFGVRRAANDIEKLILDFCHLESFDKSKDIRPPKPAFLNRYSAAREMIFFRTKVISLPPHSTPLDVKIFEIEEHVSRALATTFDSEAAMPSLMRKIADAAALYASEVDKANGVVATDEGPQSTATRMGI